MGRLGRLGRLAWDWQESNSTAWLVNSKSQGTNKKSDQKQNN